VNNKYQSTTCKIWCHSLSVDDFLLYFPISIMIWRIMWMSTIYTYLCTINAETQDVKLENFRYWICTYADIMTAIQVTSSSRPVW